MSTRIIGPGVFLQAIHTLALFSNCIIEHYFISSSDKRKISGAILSRSFFSVRV